MTTAQEILDLIEMSTADLERSLSKKSHIHNLEVTIRTLQNQISMDKNPETKKSKQDRLAQKQATLAKLKGH